MNKPNSLRKHLLEHITELRNDPDRLLIFIENGKIRSTAAAGLSFEYEYNLQMIITDFAGHPDSVMIPLLGWLRTNQHELLANFDKNKDGIQFDAEIMANDLVDLSITLPLSERVIVKPQEDGTLDVKHPQEPQLAEGYPEQKYQLIIDGEPVTEWESKPSAPDIETPNPKRPKQ